MSRRGVHDWDKLLREISSGEDSDEGDSLNVLSVQKNARRVCDLLRDMAPPGGLAPPGALDDKAKAAAREVVPPRGMNPDVYRQMQRDILSAGRDAAGAPGPPGPSHSPLADLAGDVPASPPFPPPAEGAETAAEEQKEEKE